MRRCMIWNGELLGRRMAAVSTSLAIAATGLLLFQSRPSLHRSAPAGKQLELSAPCYRVIDLGLPEGAQWLYSFAASPDFHYVAGYVSTATIMRPFLWHDGAFAYLGTQQAAAWAVDNTGKVAGELVPDEHSFYAAAWSNGKTERLFQDNSNSHAKGIDTAGNLYGSCVDPTLGHVWRAFVHSRKGITTYLDKENNRNSFFQAVNAKKQVLLRVASRNPTEEKDYKTVIRENNQLYDLPSLQPDQVYRVCAINDKGVAVGGYRKDGLVPMPLVWKNKKPELLKTPPIQAGYATGINNKGDIIGWASLRKTTVDMPFLIHRGKFYEVKKLLVDKADIRRLVQISDNGVILAEGYVNNKRHAFLLTPK